MTMHKALHPRDDIDRLYVSRNEGGRGLTSIEVRVNASLRGLKSCIKKTKERQITEAKSSTDNQRITEKQITRKQKWEEKQL